MRELPEYHGGEIILYRGRQYVMVGGSYSFDVLSNKHDDVRLHFQSVESYSKEVEKYNAEKHERKVLERAKRMARRRRSAWLKEMCSFSFSITRFKSQPFDPRPKR